VRVPPRVIGCGSYRSRAEEVLVLFDRPSKRGYHFGSAVDEFPRPAGRRAWSTTPRCCLRLMIRSDSWREVSGPPGNLELESNSRKLKIRSRTSLDQSRYDCSAGLFAGQQIRFAAAVAFRRRPQISSSKVSRFRSTLPKVRFRDRGSGISNAPLLERAPRCDVGASDDGGKLIDRVIP